MTTFAPKSGKKAGLTIGGIILVLLLIGGSFLAGRSFQADNSETTKSRSETAEVTERDETEETEDTSTVFDSTEEEIEEVKVEQEKITEETEQKVEEAKTQLQTSEPQNEYTLSKTITEGIPGGCALTILYTPEASEPELWKGAVVLNGSQGDGEGVTSLFCRTNTGTVRGTSLDKAEVREFFTAETYERITYVGLSNNPNNVENGFLSYIVDIDDGEYELSLRMKQDNKLRNNKISLSSKPTVQTVTTETYTNPYFPDFELVYPSDWKFETFTSPSDNPRLLNRVILLNKNDAAILQFSFTPNTTDCSNEATSRATYLRTLDNGLREFSGPEIGTIYEFSDTYECANNNVIATNIDNGEVKYKAYVSLYTPLGQQTLSAEETEKLLNEGVEILENATIR